MQGHQIVSDLRKLVGPGTRQEQVPLGQASPSLLSAYVRSSRLDVSDQQQGRALRHS